MTRKTQQILIVTAILMTVALLMVVVGGMGVGEPDADSVEIYLNEIDTLVTDNPEGADPSSRLDTIAQRAQDLEVTRAEDDKMHRVAAPTSRQDPAPEASGAVQVQVEEKKQAAVAKAEERANQEAKKRAVEKAAEVLPEEAVAVVEQPVIDDTDEEPKAKKKKVKREGKPSKMKEFVKSYAKRVKPILEARGLDLSELEGRSPGDQIKLVGKKLIEALRANGGSFFKG
jgi:hypothetical protein